MEPITDVASLLLSGMIIAAAGCTGGGQEVAPMSFSTSSISRLVLRGGTYQGECFVDCEEEITVTAETTVYELRSPFPDAAHPDILESRPTDPAVWERLRNLVDLEALNSLPVRLGDPDAADSGGEWIEVEIGDERRRVDFELGASEAALEPLSSELRRARAELSRIYRAKHRGGEG